MTTPNRRIGRRKKEEAVIQLPGMIGFYAGFTSRFMALAIDTIIVTLSFISLTWFFSVTFTILQLRSLLGLSINDIPGSAGFIDTFFGPVVGFIITMSYVIGYYVIFWSLIGQTPGKALLGLRVVPLKGIKVSPLRALMRFLCYFISALPLGLGFIWVLIDDQRQAWHDKLAGTLVIYAWEARLDEKFLKDELDEMDSQGRNSHTEKPFHS